MVTVSELKAYLEGLEEEGFGGFEVRLTTQSSWALEGQIDNFCHSERRKTVYLAGNGTEYGSEAVWEIEQGCNLDDFGEEDTL